MTGKQGEETAAELSYHLLHDGTERLMLPGWTCLFVYGGEANEWLQGQVSNDVSRLNEDQAIRAALLNPTGQMIADVVVCRDASAHYLLFEGQLLAAVHERLEQFLITEDVQLEANGRMIDVDLGYSLGAPSEFQFSAGDERFSYRLMDDKHEPYTKNEELFNLITLEQHWPQFEKDYTHKTLAMELGEKFVATRISFEKGCYVGQEVVHRIYARGHTNKTWTVLKTPNLLGPGADLLSPSGERAGYVTRSAISPKNGPICGAWLANQSLENAAEIVCGSLRFSVEPLD